MRFSTRGMRLSSFGLLIVTAIMLNIYARWEDIWTVWAKRYVRDQDIIITFTTTPNRIRLLEEPLLCLARQNIPVRGIYISVPHVFKRDNTEYTIPEWLEADPRVTILRTEDYGPATKILGALKNAPLTDKTIIIAVDDDTCYPDNLVLNLAVRAKMFPDQAIGASGSELDFTRNIEGGVVKVYKDKANVTVVEGFAGIAYRRNFFDDSIYDITKEPAFCYLSDDVYISHHLARNNVARQALNNRFLDVRTNVRQLVFGYKDDALYMQGNSQATRYKQCLAYLQHKFPAVVFDGNGIRGSS